MLRLSVARGALAARLPEINIIANLSGNPFQRETHVAPAASTLGEILAFKNGSSVILAMVAVGDRINTRFRDCLTRMKDPLAPGRSLHSC